MSTTALNHSNTTSSISFSQICGLNIILTYADTSRPIAGTPKRANIGPAYRPTDILVYLYWLRCDFALALDLTASLWTPFYNRQHYKANWSLYTTCRYVADRRLNRQLGIMCSGKAQRSRRLNETLTRRDISRSPFVRLLCQGHRGERWESGCKGLCCWKAEEITLEMLQGLYGPERGECSIYHMRTLWGMPRLLNSIYQ